MPKGIELNIRTYIMKFRFLAISALALAVLATAVSCEPQEQPIATDSSFVLGTNVVKVGLEGGDLWQKYRIEGPKEGRTASVTSASDWIRIKDVYSSEFCFSVAKNESGKDRIGEIQLACEGTESLRLRVIQSGSTGGESVFKNFRLEVGDITTSTCRIQVKPVDAAKTYVYAVVRKAEYDKETAKTYIESRIKQVKEMAAMNSQSPALYLSCGSVDTNTLPTEQQPYLYDRTDFYLTAFDLSFNPSDGSFSYSGDIDLLPFTSASASPSSMKLSIVQNGSFVTVKASGSNDTYICDYMGLSAWEELDNPDFAAHQYILYAKKLGYYKSYTGTHIIDLSQDKEMVKGGKYVAYAVGYRDSEKDGGLTTEVKYLEFTY